MRRRALGFSGAAVALVIAPVVARDHGQLGTTWPVTEPDLLATIESRLSVMETNGQIARLQRELVERTRAMVERPTPVPGITAARTPRRWFFDPSIVADNDIRDGKGQLIAARGTRVNPLAFVTMRGALVFIDGDDPRELEWATSTYGTGTAKIILVAGSPFAAMRTYKRRVFFDQHGQLTSRFGIVHTPAIVRAEADRLVIEERVLAPRGRT